MSTEKRPNSRRIADKLGSPNRLSGDLLELVQNHYLHVDRPNEKEHIYTITKPGLGQLIKYETDTEMDSFRRMVMLGQSQTLRRIFKHATLRRVRCKKCGATTWDEGNKKIKVKYESYDDDFLIPSYHCTGCGAKTKYTWVGEDTPGGPEEDVDNSNFIEEDVSMETALQE